MGYKEEAQSQQVGNYMYAVLDGDKQRGKRGVCIYVLYMFLTSPLWRTSFLSSLMPKHNTWPLIVCPCNLAQCSPTFAFFCQDIGYIEWFVMSTFYMFESRSSYSPNVPDQHKSMSGARQKLDRLMVVHSIESCIYQPQTDGLVWKFNRTGTSRPTRYHAIGLKAWTVIVSVFLVTSVWRYKLRPEAMKPDDLSSSHLTITQRADVELPWQTWIGWYICWQQKCRGTSPLIVGMSDSECGRTPKLPRPLCSASGTGSMAPLLLTAGSSICRWPRAGAPLQVRQLWLAFSRDHYREKCESFPRHLPYFSCEGFRFRFISLNLFQSLAATVVSSSSYIAT